MQRDASSIAAALIELASDGALRKRMGQAARAKVEQQFTWDLIAERTESFYQRLVEARRDTDAVVT